MNTSILIGTAALVISLAVTFFTIASVAFLGMPARGEKRNKRRDRTIVIVVVAILALISWFVAAVAGIVGALIGSTVAALLIFARKH